ncbi:MAG: AtzG-like protein [Burkholderiaceae bacterium]|jgi:hypothetical protein
MQPSEYEEYVAAALTLAGYSFDAPQRALIAAEFARIAGIAADFVDEPLAVELEPITLFRP